MTTDANNGRYPYTYAADHLRMVVGDDYGKGLISRAAASLVWHEVAKCLGLDERKVAEAIANKYLETRNP